MKICRNGLTAVRSDTNLYQPPQSIYVNDAFDGWVNYDKFIGNRAVQEDILNYYTDVIRRIISNTIGNFNQRVGFVLPVPDPRWISTFCLNVNWVTYVLKAYLYLVTTVVPEQVLIIPALRMNTDVRGRSPNEIPKLCSTEISKRFITSLLGSPSRVYAQFMYGNALRKFKDTHVALRFRKDIPRTIEFPFSEYFSVDVTKHVHMDADIDPDRETTDKDMLISEVVGIIDFCRFCGKRDGILLVGGIEVEAISNVLCGILDFDFIPYIVGNHDNLEAFYGLSSIIGTRTIFGVYSLTPRDSQYNVQWAENVFEVASVLSQYPNTSRAYFSMHVPLHDGASTITTKLMYKHAFLPYHYCARVQFRLDIMDEEINTSHSAAIVKSALMKFALTRGRTSYQPYDSPMSCGCHSCYHVLQTINYIKSQPISDVSAFIKLL